LGEKFVTKKPRGERNRRHRTIVDAKIQRVLAVRMILHSLCFMIVGGLLAAIAQYFAAPMTDRGQLAESIGRNFALYALGFVLLGPALMLDSFRLSNRIVGPICRLRETVRQIAQNDQIVPLQFRSGDYWQDIPEQFNAMVEKLRDEREQKKDTEESVAVR
jgi:nitrogen fixation/metabolism regulation signal transduction histidine kinase